MHMRQQETQQEGAECEGTSGRGWAEVLDGED